MWRVKSKLAEELEKHEPKVEEFHIGLEQEKFPLTMKEMLTRRREAAKLRAYQGYKEAKARRQNKIKSKKYHRIQKRETIKKKLKEFEQLQKTDPEEALKKLEEIEKTRVQERFSLRHKSTGKWARNQQIRAKYDKESRQNLAQQLALSKELVQKSKVDESESDEEQTVEKTPIVIDESNPWVNGVKPGKEVADFVSGYRKYWMEQNKIGSDENKEENDKQEIEKLSEASEAVNDERMKQQKKTILHKNKKKMDDQLNSTSTTEWQVDIVENYLSLDEMFSKAEVKQKRKLLNNVKKLKSSLNMKPPRNKKTKKEKKEKEKKTDLSLPIQKRVPQVDEPLNNEHNEENPELLQLQKILLSESQEKDSGNIDPEKYMKVKPTNLSTAIPDVLTTEENDEETNQRAVISEAFEDDDILDEFNKDKNDEIDKGKPKDINLSLPGWGSWGGTNVKVNKRKKRRFIIKAPPKMPRRDDNKGFLIINESAQSKIKEHRVSEVPFPFKTVKDFEASMRAPISNTFMPETAYKKLIKPAVSTKMGAIIEPISKDVLLNRKS